MPKIKIFLDKGNNNNNSLRRVLAQTAKTRGGTLEVPAYREENFAVPEKISIFEKRLAKDCRKFSGGQISMRRVLAAESPPRGCFAHTAILSWHMRTVTPKRIQPPIRTFRISKRTT